MSAPVNLTPRTFETRLGGLFFFHSPHARPAPDRGRTSGRLPGFDHDSRRAGRAHPAGPQTPRQGTHPPRHGLVADQGIALFAGLNVVPKRSYLAAYSSQVDDRANAGLMAAWFHEIERARTDSGPVARPRLPHRAGQYPARTPGKTLYLAPLAQSARHPYLPRARCQPAALCYARAGIPKAEQPAEIIRFVDFWQQHTGSPPQNWCSIHA